jgi:hypothetical protein
MVYRQSVGTFDLSVGRSRRSVRIGDAIRSHVTILIIGTGLLICGLCFLYLWQGTTILDLTAQCAASQERLSGIEETNGWLELKIMETFSLERVARVAREQLGMIEPMTIRYVKRTAASDGS